MGRGPRRDPPGPRGRWLTGSLRDLQKNPLAFYSELAGVYGGIARFRLLHRTLYVVSHPDYAWRVLVTHQANYPRSFHYDNLKLVFGESLLSTDGEVWKTQRRRAQPAFHGETLARLPEIVTACARDMLLEWDAACREGREIDVAAEMVALSSRVLGLALLSVDLRLQNQDFAGAIGIEQRFVLKRNTSLVRLPIWLPTRRNLSHRRAKAALDAFVTRVIEERRRAAQPPEDILTRLVRARDPETGTLMEKRELHAQILTAFVAGFETTARALAWTFYLLSQHPEAEERLCEELSRELQGRPPDAGHHQFAAQVIDEAMRLYPPIYAMGRRSLNADEIGGYDIPPGSPVIVSVYDLHRSPDFWDDPDRFRPERFAPENAGRLHRSAYMPFAAGPHRCVGAGFALLTMPLALAAISRRYRLRLRPGHPVVPRPAITLIPENGLPMRLERRS